MGLAYRAAGADAPWQDPRRAHGVPMEGYFWRFTDAPRGRVVAALCGVCAAADGTWSVVALATHPGGAARERVTSWARADPQRLGVSAGPDVLEAAGDRLRVDLGPDARLDVRIDDPVAWPRRLGGGSGLGHLVPGLGQYWHPHLLGGRAHGTVTLGGETIVLDGAQAYAEKNWGSGFPGHWWWGQAQGFEREDACVAFAGGPARVGPVELTATAVVVRLGDTLVRLGDPVLSPVRAEVGDGEWRLRGRGPVWGVELEGSGPLSAAHVLPVPLPERRRAVPGALEHLGAELRVVLRRRGRVAWRGESRLAGLEQGGLDLAAAEMLRRAPVPEEEPHGITPGA